MSKKTTTVRAMAEKTYKGNDLQRGERLQIMLEADELRALDDFRFANRMPSRAAAVRELLRRGLGVDGVVVNHGDGSSKSFGVLDATPPEDGAEP
jgi:hypothetical protein